MKTELNVMDFKGNAATVMDFKGNAATQELRVQDSFTSTGRKFFTHQEVMRNLKAGVGRVVATTVLATDICQHSCAFCSVLTRVGDTLPLPIIDQYLDKLIPFGLRAVTLSGGGNPILYRCRETGAGFDALVQLVASKGLEIGLICNGMKMKKYPCGRTSWVTTKPETLDKFKWIRISMSGLDHEEREVYVPDVDPSKTTLGFSYVYHDIYQEEQEPNHGKVSTLKDLIGEFDIQKVEYGHVRLPWLQEQIKRYVEKFKPVYVRLLPNCLEVDKIESRCVELQKAADFIDPDVAFVQYKPPCAPTSCTVGYLHPCLNSDGFVYPCTSVVLNEEAGHRFNEPWRVCRWDEIDKIYNEPVRSLLDSQKLCPGCVFSAQNQLLEKVWKGEIDTPMPEVMPTHPNFV